MFNFKRIIYSIIFLIFLCGYSFPQVDPEGKLIFSLGGDISLLNPILSSDSASAAVEGAVFSGLVRVNENLEIIPDMARSWKVSSGGKVWTFYLRKDILWHDGKSFTAEDVKFTFDSILDPKVNSIRRGDYIIDGKPIIFKIIDKYTVQAILPKAFAPFLLNAGMGILPKHLLYGKDINTAGFNRHPIGTGPFKFLEWKEGDHVSVVRNSKYYLGSPKLAQIIYRVIPDANTRLVALETREIDSSDIPPLDYQRMLTSKKLNIFVYDALGYTYLGFNLDNPLFADKRVRRALAYATDKQKLVDIIFKGLATPAYSPSAPISWAHNPNVNKYPYDLNKVKKLLKEAGYDKGFEFTILLNQGNKEREKAALILQQQWKKLGVNVKIKVLEWSALLRKVHTQDFEAVIIGWSLSIDPDSYSIWHSTQHPRGLNFIHYSNPEVDKLLELGRTTIDKKKRAQIYKKIDAMIADDQPYIFLWYPKSIAGVNKRVGGLSKPGPAGLFVDIHRVFVTK